MDQAGKGPHEGREGAKVWAKEEGSLQVKKFEQISDLNRQTDSFD